MRRRVFALIDVDNFYAACQELFDGTIRGRPVIVLSNNDACVIARNRAAKALNIAMGIPFFQIQDVVERYGVCVYSACYALYQDLSDRIMAVLARFGVAQEMYSIVSGSKVRWS